MKQSFKKICIKCGSSENEFTRSSQSPDGLNAWCKQCTREASREWYKANKIRKLSVAKKWRENNPDRMRALVNRWADEHPDRMREIGREYRRRNPDKSKDYQAAHPDKVKEWTDRYWKKNPEKAYTKARNRRARLRNAEGSHTADDVKRILISQDFKCAACSQSLRKKYHVDHIVALVNGGSNWPENLQILCPKCNCKKGSKDNEEFLLSLRRAA